MEMVIPYQLCRTIGPLRFLLASAKAQPRWDLLNNKFGEKKRGNKTNKKRKKCILVTTCIIM